MVGELLAALEGSAMASGLRGSTWSYPLVNAAHILGIGLLIGAIAALDLRMAGLWRSVPLAPIARVLVPVAGCGLGLAIVAGGLLFAAKATEYAASGYFQAKMALLVAGLANIAAVHALRLTRYEEDRQRLRRALAVLSLAIWVGVLLLGRLVGYF